MKIKLKEMGFPANKIEFVEATNREKSSWNKALKEIGRTKKPIFTPKVLKTIHTPKTQGEIGNFLSHIRTWSKVGSQKPGYYLVLEDDVCPSQFWFQKSKDQLFNKIKNDFLFLYLGDCWRSHSNKSKSISVRNQSLIRDFTYCLHAYLITPSFGMIINSLCNNSDILFPLSLPSDHWLPNFLNVYQIPFYIYKKPLIIQNSGIDTQSDSDIGNPNEDDSRWDIDEETQAFKCYR